MELSELDKTRIKLDIKIFMMLSLLFLGLVIVFLGLISGAVLFFEPKEGFYSRILNIFSVFALLIIAMNFNNLLKYVDLRIGKKIRIQSNSYEIREKKKSAFVVIQEPKLKIEIDDKLVPLINLKLPLIIEFTKNSKTVLFISNNDKNMLEVIENEII